MEGFSIQNILHISTDVIVLILLAAVVILFVIAVMLLRKVRQQEEDLDVFMEGKDAKSLEDTLIRRLEQIDSIQERTDLITETLKLEKEYIDRSFQKVGLIKYNAFNEMGGKLSFSLCLLDRKKNGVIITAMHSREGCYTYIKEVIDGNSVLLLADEEQQALADALAN